MINGSFFAITLSLFLVVLVVIVFLAQFLIIQGGIRPDFYAYPFYKNSVETEELRLQKYVNEVCTKAHCKFQYSVKVFKWSILRYYIAYVVQNNKTIFIKHYFIENFNEDEKKFIISHEIGHHVLSTINEMKADSFAVKYSSIKIGVETLKKTSFLMKLKKGEPTQILLQKRIQALEK